MTGGLRAEPGTVGLCRNNLVLTHRLLCTTLNQNFEENFDVFNKVLSSGKPRCKKGSFTLTYLVLPYRLHDKFMVSVFGSPGELYGQSNVLTWHNRLTS